jgi:gas vesicle protein
MEDSERQIALVKLARTESFSIVDYDLYITEKRMIFIRTKSTGRLGTLLGGVAGGAVGGIAAGALEAAIKRGKKGNDERMDKATLDELLNRDKKNFDLAYEDIREVKLWNRFHVRHFVIYSKRKEADFPVSEENFEKLSTVLPSIPALGERVKIH